MWALAGPTPITTCPHCSILVNGSCEVCQDGDPHPSCQDCRGGSHRPPWYRSELTLAVISAVVVSVASAVIVAKLNKTLKVK